MPHIFASAKGYVMRFVIQGLCWHKGPFSRLWVSAKKKEPGVIKERGKECKRLLSNPKSIIWERMIKSEYSILTKARDAAVAGVLFVYRATTPYHKSKRYLRVDMKCLSIPRLDWPLQSRACRHNRGWVYSWRRWGLWFFGKHISMAHWHLSSWLVGWEQWQGECEP